MEWSDSGSLGHIIMVHEHKKYNCRRKDHSNSKGKTEKYFTWLARNSFDVQHNT